MGASAVGDDESEPALLLINDISLVIPQRKKYALEFVASRIRARTLDTKALVPGINYAWKDIGSPLALLYIQFVTPADF